MGMTVSEKDHFKQRLAEQVRELSNRIGNNGGNWRAELCKQALQQAEEYYSVNAKLAMLKTWQRRQHRVERRITRLQRQIVAEMRGLLPAHVSNNSIRERYSYGGRSQEDRERAPFLDDDFVNYPGDSRSMIKEMAEYKYKQLFEAHPIGQQLTQLKQRAAILEDQLVAAATHTQLQQVWKDAANQFNIIMTETAERQSRKVSTGQPQETTGKRTKK